MKINNRSIQTTYYCGGRGGRGGHGHQVRGRRGGHRGRGRGKERINDDWGVTGLIGRIIRVHRDYRFENYQWFNNPE